MLPDCKLLFKLPKARMFNTAVYFSGLRYMSDRYMKQDITFTMSHSVMFVTDLCVAE